MRAISYRPIGLIHSPFKDIKGVPIQPTCAQQIKGSVEIASEYGEGLSDLEGFSHIILVYDFHLSKGYSLKVKPFLDNRIRGVFATRAPKRPNSIGISIVRLIKIEGCTLHIEDVDIVDGTPLLDIKPYVSEFDVRNAGKTGWLSERIAKLKHTKADERFR